MITLEAVVSLGDIAEGDVVIGEGPGPPRSAVPPPCPWKPGVQAAASNVPFSQILMSVGRHVPQGREGDPPRPLVVVLPLRSRGQIVASTPSCSPWASAAKSLVENSRKREMSPPATNRGGTRTRLCPQCPGVGRCKYDSAKYGLFPSDSRMRVPT